MSGIRKERRGKFSWQYVGKLNSAISYPYLNNLFNLEGNIHHVVKTHNMSVFSEQISFKSLVYYRAQHLGPRL